MAVDFILFVDQNHFRRDFFQLNRDWNRVFPFTNLISVAMLETVLKLLNTTGDRMKNGKTDECFEAVLIIDAADHDLT
jgi:hypothetical protein